MFQVVRACQVSSKQILRGQDCCNMFLGNFRLDKIKTTFQNIIHNIVSYRIIN